MRLPSSNVFSPSDFFMPHMEEKKLINQMQEARRGRDREKEVEAEQALVHLYIYYGEYFKMSDRPDSIQAEKYIRKALKHQKDHPIANYRLAHLLYRKEEYAEAVQHFQRALIGMAGEALNDTQTMLTNRFITGKEIKGKLFEKQLEQQISDATIRQTFRRMKQRLPFWDEIIETTAVGNKIGRKRKEGITYCVLCRASDILPDGV